VCVCVLCVGGGRGRIKAFGSNIPTEHRSHKLISLPHVREFPVLKISPKPDTITHIFVVCLIAFSIDASRSFG